MLLTPSLTRNLESERVHRVAHSTRLIKRPVFTSVLTAIALVLTVYRVVYRVAIHRFWWEDACAVIALIGSVICVITSWSHFELGKAICPLSTGYPPTHPAGQPSLISFWIYTFTYPTVVWFVVHSMSPDDLLNISCRSVRLSILLSILRITPPSRNSRRAMIFIAGLFVLMWISLMIAFVWSMSGQPWYTSPSQQDRERTRSVAIFELIGTSFFVLACRILTGDIADILSDCTLISLPIYSLRSVKLPYCQRRLIVAAFSSSIVVTAVSFFRAACQVFNVPLISVAIDVQVCDDIAPNPELSHSISDRSPVLCLCATH